MSSLFSKPKAPPVPDPVATANAQGAANAETARVQQKMNMVDQYNPYGSTTFTPIGDDRYRVDTRLSPLGQQAFDSEQRIDAATNRLAEGQLGRISDAVSRDLDFSAFPSLATDFSADRDRATQSLIDRNAPMMERQQSRLENQLANQGIARGSEAWKAAYDDLSRQQNDFNLAAINAGGAEQSRMYGLTADARQRMINELLQQRAQPINELGALLGTGQVAVPQAAGIPQTNVNGTDVIGANTLAYNAMMNNYNQQMGAGNSALGALAGLGGAGLSAYGMGAFGGGAASTLPWLAAGSDIRLKEDITPIGRRRGLKFYRWRYKGDPMRRLWEGVMAQDLLHTRPDAVLTMPNGFYAVDYGLLGIRMKEVA